MTTCPKCHFINEQQQATDCPKCGLIYTKFQKAKEEENRHMFAERSLNDSLNRATSYRFKDPSAYIDFEPERDARTYPMVNWLVWFFIIISGCLVLFSVYEIKYLWALLSNLQTELNI